MGEEYRDISYFKMPECTNLPISLPITCLLSSLVWKGLTKNWDVPTTGKSTSILGHVSISSVRLNTPLY